MPQPSTLKINEIFWSFQGEGIRVGYPSIFLRLAGCTYGCPYCDTRGAWETGEVLPIDEILTQIDGYRKKYPRSQVVITGGEPLEQDLGCIVDELKQRDYFISIETNGGHFQDLPLDWWVVSPKDVADYFIHRELSKRIDEIKLVVNTNLTPDVVKKIRATVERVPIFLQPDGNEIRRFEQAYSLFTYCQEIGVENIRCGVQLHNVYHAR